MTTTYRYAELHAHSAYSFLDGANDPEDLARAAAELGLEALALTDHDGLPGIVRHATAGREVGLPTVHGAELTLADGSHLPVLARDPRGYRHLAAAISRHNLDAGERTDPAHRLPVLAAAARGGVPTPGRGPARGAESVSPPSPHRTSPHTSPHRWELGDLGGTASGPVGWFVLTGTANGPLRRALCGHPAAPDGDHRLDPARWDLPAARARLDELVDLFGADNIGVELTLDGGPADAPLTDALTSLAHDTHLPLVATGAVRCARPTDSHLADVLTATRLNLDLETAAGHLPALGRWLRGPTDMVRLHRRAPHAVDVAADLAADLAFDLALVVPGLPPAEVPPGHTPATWLRELTWRGAVERYGTRTANPHAWRVIDHELEVIESLDFPGYFLIVRDIVEFCGQAGILCQGRGSAANSAVCYALGVTAVDAVRHKMLFERFLSSGRSGPPDIDLDIEACRREEVIQHVYSCYGRDYAAQVANVISYRPRSAIRDAARALGYSTGLQDAWASRMDRWSTVRTDGAGAVGSVPGTAASPPPARDIGWFAGIWEPGRPEERVTEGEVPDVAARPTPSSSVPAAPGRPPDPVPADQPPPGPEHVPEKVLATAESLLRLPRHLGIHSGGMVLCDRPVIEVCPVRWGAMPGRSVLQWDKDDCAEVGLVKFDLLGLGMLTALRLAFTSLTQRGEKVPARVPGGAPHPGPGGAPHPGPSWGLHTLPEDDPAVYQLLQAADTVGVFQVESRAQMATLPRLRPSTFYDIVVEVALIRPGPIQGDAVNPYIRRRLGREEPTFAHELLRPALEKTLGVPLFQEQLMQIAIDAAGFSPAEADDLRKAMGSKRSLERMEALHTRLVDGMRARGMDRPTAELVFDKLRAFANFGFPESHAFSFAYLVYASAWLKARRPEDFYAGLLAAQPMGFWSPQTLVADARRHGVRVLPADVNHSAAEACVEPVADGAAQGSTAGAPSGHPPLTPSPHALSPLDTHPDLAVRLGLSRVKGVGKAVAEQVVAERDAHGPYQDLADLARRVRLSRSRLESLAGAGALGSLGASRREGLWAAGVLAGESGTRRSARGSRQRSSRSRRGEGTPSSVKDASAVAEPGHDWYQPPLPGTAVGAEAPELAPMTVHERHVADLRLTGVSTETFPTVFLRPRLDAVGVVTVAAVASQPDGARVRVGGVVTHRQRPGTAAGTVFLNIEDETGLLNVICSGGMWRRFRDVGGRAAAVLVRGTVENADGVTALLAEYLEPLEGVVPMGSRDWC